MIKYLEDIWFRIVYLYYFHALLYAVVFGKGSVCSNPLVH